MYAHEGLAPPSDPEDEPGPLDEPPLEPASSEPPPPDDPVPDDPVPDEPAPEDPVPDDPVPEEAPLLPLLDEAPPDDVPPPLLGPGEVPGDWGPHPVAPATAIPSARAKRVWRLRTKTSIPRVVARRPGDGSRGGRAGHGDRRTDA